MATIDSMNRDTTRLSDGPDWTFELLKPTWPKWTGSPSSIVLTPTRTRSKSLLPSR